MTNGSPTKLWYVLAIFTGIFGGLVGYFVLKNRDAKMAKNVLIVSIVATIVGALFDFFVTIPYLFG